MLPRLHIVTDDELVDAPDFEQRAEYLVREFGSRIALHLRSRTSSGQRLYALGLQLGRLPGACIVINDRVDIARVIQAYAVQLPATALPIQRAREQLVGTLIGKSVHSLAEGKNAVEAGADFLLAGSIYATTSHPDVRPQGSALISGLRTCGVPVLAIGGVDANRAGECVEAGAYGVAVIRAVWQARDADAAATELLQRIEEGRERV